MAMGLFSEITFGFGVYLLPHRHSPLFATIALVGLYCTRQWDYTRQLKLGKEDTHKK